MPIWKDGQLQGGTPAAHGSSHAFGASDAIPGGEQIEATYSCTATESVGDVVFLFSAGDVRQANATDNTKMPMQGFIKSKPTVTTCILVGYGELGGFSGLTPDQLYYVDIIDGQITAISPSGSGNIEQVAGRAIDSTTLFIKPGTPITRKT